ncbi:development-specific protein LVN1.2-like [Diadema antillarum]|uniref:development-specific protein LVN1.2-like n=1 Tax=Diadema antillarum TaxID=105358 RepID=UPI003A895579
MHLIVFLVAAAVAVVNAHKPCCAPDKFMSGLSMVWSETDPRHGTRNGEMYLYGAYDFAAREFGFYMMSTIGFRTSYSRIIQKFAQKSTWIILDDLQYCEKRTMSSVREPSNCLRENGTYTGSAVIGGPNGVPVDNWKYGWNSHHSGRGCRGTLHLSVVQETCFPLGKIFTGKFSMGPGPEIFVMNSGGMMNMTLGIPDPERWFTVPSYCSDESIDMPSRRPVEMPSLDLLGPLFY